MSVLSLGTQHLTLHSAEHVHEVFRRLGYDVYDPEAFEGDDLDQFDLTDAGREIIQRAYLVANRDNHTVYLYEVTDMRQIRLRELAWNALQRGTALLVVTTSDYREVLFVDPRFVGKPNKSNVRVNKLKVLSSTPTRHDLDTLNAIHAHRRTGQQIYDAQAEAFNVNTITKKFYDEYRRHYEHARAMVRQYNPGVREFQNSDQTDKLHAFTQRLLGRLMFLYFLQRKGWLGERQRFLTEKYNETMRQHSHELHGDGETFYYYTEVLQPLFFETLNKMRPDNITLWQGIRITYLNGGLFDESRDPKGPIILPDSLFDPNSNEGLLAFFNRYNFTIEDDTPLEQDVSVDPEMLGKVFENMLEERDRGQSGSFYTPRTIVSYMCQEALAGYLEESASVPREKTRAQFDPDSDTRYTPEEAERVNAALDTMTALDPAVGSGSFLIGMLNEIMRLRRMCYAVLHDGQAAPSSVLANWKEAIIRDTLYGVDIKPEAIEIAQLRLWLSLVVDQTLEQARPLPNLDYKLMAGNSLIETIDGEPVLSAKAQEMLDDAARPPQMGLFDYTGDEQAIKKLADLRKEYFSAAPKQRTKLNADIRFQERRIIEAGLNDMLENVTQRIRNIEKKYQLKGSNWLKADANKYTALLAKEARLNSIKRDLWNDKATLPFFLYRLHFNDVLDPEKKGGFDVVVANPPYVRQELISDQKPDLQASYPDIYAGTADLFVYFFARAADLLRKNGHLSFITPNKFMRANYGKKLRAFLADKTCLHTLIDFGDLPIFDATTYPMITIASNQRPADNTINVLEITALNDIESLHDATERAYKLPQSTLSGEGWQLSDPKTRALMDKLKAAGKPLGEYVEGKIYYGIKTGLNEAFIIDEAKREELITADPKSAEIIKPYLRGRDVKRWATHWAGLYLIFTRRGIAIEQYLAIKAHLEQYRDQLTPGEKGGRKAGSYQWYEIQDNIAYHAEFEKPKIVFPSIVNKPTFTFDINSYYSNDKTTIIGTDDVFIMAVLNSRIQDFFFQQIASTKRGGYFEQKPMYVEQIPIPDVPEPLRQKIASLAQQCLDAAKDTPDKLPALEAALNQLVYQAYGLDDDDIALIEGRVDGSSNG